MIAKMCWTFEIARRFGFIVLGSRSGEFTVPPEMPSEAGGIRALVDETSG
jgi:hypothetical protein